MQGRRLFYTNENMLHWPCVKRISKFKSLVCNAVHHRETTIDSAQLKKTDAKCGWDLENETTLSLVYLTKEGVCSQFVWIEASFDANTSQFECIRGDIVWINVYVGKHDSVKQQIPEYDILLRSLIDPETL